MTLRQAVFKVLTKCTWLPDEIALKLMYRVIMGHRLDLKNPKTFQAKINWLKLHDKKPEYVNLVDKLTVKAYVSNLIGSQHVIPTLGVWNCFDEIDFNNLPDKFVLKTNHGGGSNGVMIVSDKSSLDIAHARRKLNKAIRLDISKNFREWPYKDVSRKIFAEQYIEDNTREDLKDYKFFCFNGVPKFFKVDFNRFSKHQANYYDLNWNLLPFGEIGLMPDTNKIILPPPNFDKMIDFAKKLSVGLQFVRVDLYNVAGNILFGELTLYPASGLGPFAPDEWNYIVGDYLNL